MSTKEQYEFFRSLHASEEKRYSDLESRAKFYLSIVGIFLATILFKVSEVKLSFIALSVPWWVALVEALLLCLSLFFIVMGTLIRSYEAVTDPRSVATELDETSPSDEEFYDNRIADYAVATERNRKANNRTAAYLQVASITLVTAMAILVTMLALTFYH